MLGTDPDDRLGLLQVREHDWCRKNHPCNAPPVTITPKGDDNTLSTTVLPYLIELHSAEASDLENQPYITEHDLHEHKRQMEAEASQILRQHSTTASEQKTTKCIKVKKITGCSVSWCIPTESLLQTDVWNSSKILCIWVDFLSKTMLVVRATSLQ